MLRSILRSLANEEMRDITEDRYGEEVWGSVSSDGAAGPESSTRPKLFFYFGENDYWMTNKTRDAIIAARAFQSTLPLADRKDWQVDSRPWMEIDQHNTDHNFCVEGSRVVAEKVVEYMRMVLGNK